MVRVENSIYPSEIVYGGNHLNSFEDNVMLMISLDKLKYDFILSGKSYVAEESTQYYIDIFTEHYPELFSEDKGIFAVYSDEAEAEIYDKIANLLII